MGTRSRYAWSVLAALLLLIVLNIAERAVLLCNDCARPYGLPFTNWISEGFVEPSRYVKWGLIADFAAATVVGIAVGAAWNRHVATRVK